MERLAYLSNNEVRIKTDSVEKLARKLAEYEDFEEIFRAKMTETACEFLKDKEEFGKWLDRNKWITRKCDEWVRAEEQGLLLRLPCKDAFESSGGAVYYIFDYEIVECINCGVSIDCERKLWIALACDEHIFPYRRPIPEIDLDPTDWCNNTTEVSVDEWGKTIFLTKAEAEWKLKEMERD